MRKLIIQLSVSLMFFGIQSCQKSDTTVQTATSESTRKAAIVEVTNSAAVETGIQDVDALCLEKYDGLGDAVKFGTGFINGKNHQFFKIPRLNNCATVTVSDSLFPKQITIDYGTGCTDQHQRTISGKVIISISDSLRLPGSIKTITSEDLFIDGNRVDINSTFTNMGLNADGKWVIVRTGAHVLTLSDGTTAKTEGTDTLTFESGFLTRDKFDDVFYKTGGGTITINDSLVYSRTIVSPVLHNRSCKFIVSGIVELYKNGATITIDYGDGECDNVATVTTDGVTEEINLQNHKFNSEGKHGFKDQGGKGYGKDNGQGKRQGIGQGQGNGQG